MCANMIMMDDCEMIQRGLAFFGYLWLSFHGFHGLAATEHNQNSLKLIGSDDSSRGLVGSDGFFKIFHQGFPSCLGK